MLYPDKNIKQRKDETLKGSLDVFNEDHFSDVIKRLFDIYIRHPNEKTGKIIKQAFQDYITVISFIKNEVLNNNTYESVVKAIGNEFGKHIKKIANTEELKRYFEIARDSKELLNNYKNSKELLQILDVDVSQLTGDITITCEEGILCFAGNNHDIVVLGAPNNADGAFLANNLKYKNSFLPIILLRKDDADIIGTKSHEIQHYIFNILNVNLQENSKIDDMFKDEIIAQSIKSSKIVYADKNGNNIEVPRIFKFNMRDPDPYDFPFLLILEKIKSDHGVSGEEAKIYFQKDDTYKNRYLSIWDRLTRLEFDMNDRLSFARDMMKNIPNANVILTLTPFDRRENLKNIYSDEIVSE